MVFKAALLQRPSSKYASEERKIHGDIEAIVVREDESDDDELSERDKKDVLKLRDLLISQKRVLDRLLRV